MPEPTLKPREAPAAAPTAPVATGARPAAEADPKAAEGSETLRTLRELKERFDRTDKQNRDKDAYIQRLQQENAALKKRDPAAEPDPLKQNLDKALGDLDGGAMGEAIRAEIDRRADERFRAAAPHMLGRAQEVRNIDEGFGRLKALGVTDIDPAALGAKARSLPPDAAYLAALMAEGKEDEALALLSKGKTARDTEKARAEVLSLLADRSPEGASKRANWARENLLSVGGAAPGQRGQTGYMEGEGASLMYEMSLAPHARSVKDFDQWVSDDDMNGIPGR